MTEFNPGIFASLLGAAFVLLGTGILDLAEKTGKFWPQDPYKRAKVMEWLMWQMGGIGPMAGQANHCVSTGHY